MLDEAVNRQQPIQFDECRCGWMVITASSIPDGSKEKLKHDTSILSLREEFYTVVIHYDFKPHATRSSWCQKVKELKEMAQRSFLCIYVYTVWAKKNRIGFTNTRSGSSSFESDRNRNALR